MILNEAFRQQDFQKAAVLIKNYLTRNLGKVYFYPAVEQVKSAGQILNGIRFFYKNESIRLNFFGTDSLHCRSISVWHPGDKSDFPSQVITFSEGESVAKILPFLVDVLKGDVKQDGVYVNESVSPIHLAVAIATTSFTAPSLNEATYTAGDLSKTISNTIAALKQGLTPQDQYKAGGNKKYGPRWNVVIDTIKEEHPEIFGKQGTKAIIADASKIDKIDVRSLLAKVSGGSDAISFTLSGGSKETAIVPEAEDDAVERMTYEEQLDALKTGMKLMMSNATNALFLSGRGGVGKTQTVEDMLQSAGKEDGSGYFKITGSATPSGIYRILFQHKKDILLFDDSDSALGDQEGRNLFKAAADTKPKRKISWMKGGKNFVDPADYDEESDGDDTLPRYFDFTGKIIFISNLPLNKLDPDGALRTRAYVIDIDPSNTEIYDFMNKIVGKMKLDVDYHLSLEDRKEVVEVLKSRKIADKTANLRSLVRALNTRAGVEQQGGSKEEWVRFVRMFA